MEGGICLTCQEAQRTITPYMNNLLKIEEMEDFIDHIRTCKECKEELEIYYTLFIGMKLLDEQKNISNNFRMELEQRLQESEEQIVHEKMKRIQKRMYFVALLLVIALIM